MGPYREKHRMIQPSRRRQVGMTAIGFLLLASLFGIVGLGALKLVPVYLENMRMTRILDDLQDELEGSGRSPVGIRNALDSRFIVEGIRIPRDNIQIQQIREGYTVRVRYENRTPYIADIWFLVAFDKQVEIRR